LFLHRTANCEWKCYFYMAPCFWKMIKIQCFEGRKPIRFDCKLKIYWKLCSACNSIPIDIKHEWEQQLWNNIQALIFMANFSQFFFLTKIFKKIRIFTFFSTSKIKPWHINILSQNEVLVPVWIFFIRIVKKNHHIFVVRLKDSPSSLRSVFISRSLSHTPIRKTSPSVFLSHTRSHSLSDMCSVHDAAYIFHVFKLRPPQF